MGGCPHSFNHSRSPSSFPNPSLGSYRFYRRLNTSRPLAGIAHSSPNRVQILAKPLRVQMSYKIIRDYLLPVPTYMSVASMIIGLNHPNLGEHFYGHFGEWPAQQSLVRSTIPAHRITWPHNPSRKRRSV